MVGKIKCETCWNRVGKYRLNTVPREVTDKDDYGEDLQGSSGDSNDRKVSCELLEEGPHLR